MRKLWQLYMARYAVRETQVKRTTDRVQEACSIVFLGHVDSGVSRNAVLLCQLTTRAEINARWVDPLRYRNGGSAHTGQV
jgi:hypothetical protein